MGELVVIGAPLAPINRPASRSPTGVYLARLSRGSRRVVEQRLRAVVGIAGATDLHSFPFEALDYQHTAAIRSELADRYAPATANAMLSALRGVLREAWRLGLMDAERCQRACDIPSVRGSRIPKGRALASTELAALFRACDADRGLRGLRDAALLAILYSGGLRRSEAVACDCTDYRESEGAVHIRSGKGNKGRLVYLSEGAQQRLQTWVGAAGLECGPLLIRVRKGGRATSDRLSDQAVRDIIRRRCRQAGIADCSPHDMRRSMISDLLDTGIDISTVQQMAGHANVTTTQRYDRRGEMTRKRAAQSLHIPDR